MMKSTKLTPQMRSGAVPTERIYPDVEVPSVFTEPTIEETMTAAGETTLTQSPGAITTFSMFGCDVCGTLSKTKAGLAAHKRSHIPKE